MQPLFGQFAWFTGVVEDINDPLKIGRLRVRIVGYHTDDKQLIPTDTLPWATPIQPITSSANSGIGSSPTGIVNGTHVVGFFRDGTDNQLPVIMGTIAGFPQQPTNVERGFNDPEGVFPKVVGVNDVHELALNDEEPALVTAKLDDLEEGEPPTAYAAVYPKNHVRTTESGHVQEFDDTPEAERIHTYHKSGSFTEIHPDGSEVHKVKGEEFEVITKNKTVIVKENHKETVTLDKTVTIKGNNIEVVLKDKTVTVEGNCTVVVKGNAKLNVEGNYDVNVTGNMNLVAAGVTTVKGSVLKLN